NTRERVGLQLIDRYVAGVARRNRTQRMGLFPGTPEDLTQDVHLALGEQLGPRYLEIVEEAFRGDFTLVGPEYLLAAREVFELAVRRAVGKRTWALKKRSQRGRKQGRAPGREVPLQRVHPAD